jgi:uncharacterized protein (TIGR02453 family)
MRAFRFPSATVEFLADLGAHNNKAWFDANRPRYESGYLEPAKAFVDTIGPGLDELVPGINAEPSVRGSILRINRDIRFSSDKRPYKDHLDFWFWEGDRKAAVSGLFLRVAPDGVIIGAGTYGFDHRQLAAYRDAVADAAKGAELATIVGDLEAGVTRSVARHTTARYPLRCDHSRLLRGRRLRRRQHCVAQPALKPIAEASR